MKLVTSATMRAIDRTAIDERGIPSDELMEHAGAEIAERILEDHISIPEDSPVAVFCGTGNNGGDGFVVARHLHKAGVPTAVYFMGPLEKLTPDAKRNFDRDAGPGIDLEEIKQISDLPAELHCNIIVDAVFGTGFSGAPRGLAAELIAYINMQDSLVVAVDMPSGLNADNGQCEGEVVAADYSYVLALPKYGLLLSPGREFAGDIELVPIGIPDDVVAAFDVTDEVVSLDDVAEMLPERKPDGHKGDFGRVLLVAGSTDLTGAAALAGESALRAGCGLATVACPAGVQPVLAAKLTEVMTHPLPDVRKKGALALRSFGEIRSLAKSADALVIGPGLGRHHETFELVRRVVATLECPAVVDADALNALAGHLDAVKACPGSLVLTPHPGEFKRLSGADIPDDMRERAEIVRKFATEHNVVLVLKGSPTLIAGPGSNCYFNPTGNHGMATGGSGDVLSGIIGSFLAQGMTPLDAAVCGAYIHGMAGDFAADDLTPRAMIAGDLIKYLPRVFQLLD